MDTKKKLLEAKATDKELTDMLKDPNWLNHPFVKKWYENYDKTLKEAGDLVSSTEPEIGRARGQTTGDAANAGAGAQVYATLEIFNAVIRGFTRYMDDSFVRKYVTDSVIFKIPRVEYRELASSISVGELPHSEKTIDYATVDLHTPESEKGAKITWTRSLLEDITFDVQAEMAEGLGHAVAFMIMSDIMTSLVGVSASAEPLGENYTISSPITWAQFLAVVGSVDAGMQVVTFGLNTTGGSSNNVILTNDFFMANVTSTTPAPDVRMTLVDWKKVSTYNYVVTCLAPLSSGSTYHWGNLANLTNADTVAIHYENGTSVVTDAVLNASISGGSITYTTLGTRTYGPADFVLCSPEIYWELLNIIQMTNVLYEGSTDPIKKGVIKLALGCSILKESTLPKGTIVALNSEKAIALVTRRTLKIEPVLFPVKENEYKLSLRDWNVEDERNLSSFYSTDSLGQYDMESHVSSIVLSKSELGSLIE